jgi:hypothetical protein
VTLQAFAPRTPTFLTSTVLRKLSSTGPPQSMSTASLALLLCCWLQAESGTQAKTSTSPKTILFIGGSPCASFRLWNGGRYWDRTSDPYDVNVVLSR